MALGHDHGHPVTVMHLAYRVLRAKQVESLSNIYGMEQDMENAGLRWPCILKPLLACGPRWAHELAIVSNPEALANAQVVPRSA